jgi:DNA replication protein DnaC
LLGPPGVGKTHLALSLAIAAAERGRRVYFTTLADLLHTLEEAQAANRLAHRLRTLVFPPLMIIDEIGYLPITRTGAMLFFQLLTRRTNAPRRSSPATKALKTGAKSSETRSWRRRSLTGWSITAAS